MASDRTPAAERLAAMTAGPHSTTPPYNEQAWASTSGS